MVVEGGNGRRQARRGRQQNIDALYGHFSLTAKSMLAQTKVRFVCAVSRRLAMFRPFFLGIPHWVEGDVLQ